MIVVSGIATEHAKTGPQGGVITSRLDNRIVMKFPKGAYTKEEKISMKVRILSINNKIYFYCSIIP